VRYLQVLPRFDGLGVASHARVLGCRLQADHGLEGRYLVAERRVLPADATVVERDAEALAALLANADGAPVVLLHYSNYGYARRGCPWWLVRGLERWKRQHRGGRLVTIFHELYATGRPWQSSFWTSPVQRRLAATVTRLSDATVTSTELNARLLRDWGTAAPVHVMPVFSTVGEPDVTAPLEARAPRLVVFGSAGLRARAYRARGALRAAATSLDVTEIVDVGGGAVAPAQVDGLTVRALGEISDREVSAVLGDSRGGFLAYPPALLAKSTVFAAYCAHRMMPVVSWPRSDDETIDVPFWQPTEDLHPTEWQARADAAFAWYGRHSRSRQATLYASLLPIPCDC
jgi:hypothetical protein